MMLGGAYGLGTEVDYQRKRRAMSKLWYAPSVLLVIASIAYLVYAYLADPSPFLPSVA